MQVGSPGAVIPTTANRGARKETLYQCHFA